MSENAEAVEQEGQADFLAGFDGPTETPPGSEDKEPSETPPAEEAPAPEYVQITKDQLEDITSRLNAAVGRPDLDKAFGKIGEFERRLKDLQQQTPAGVDVTDEDFAELCAEYEHLGPLVKNVIQSVVGKLRGTGAPKFDPESVKPMLDQHLASRTQAEQESAVQALTEDHPDWRDQMYAKAEDGTILTNADGSPKYSLEFAAWLEKQPPRFQRRLEGTWDAYFIGDAIEKFQKDKEAQATEPNPQPQANKVRETRQQRVEAAITPKGAGGNPPPSKPGDDDFTAGFNAVSR